ncbi:trypsin-like serine peptidase [Shimia thalassica]|uniref:trypsin-like serine peptidase n=1 Tax=Shimia thalassica TaxID=1715693 RepID=UPI0026E30F2B|nr:trypsin-like peptidase domain-containing protein [Shimia thalassica]MDO6800582.1 trypsin-like peptidase domain-containing protein [Shimia thalassica]
MFRTILLFIFWASSCFAQPLSMVPVEAHGNWHAIGRINIAGYNTRSMCSGTLIAPDRVLTAAHCVLRADLSPFALEDITFVAGWLRGSYVAAAKPASVELHPKAIAMDGIQYPYDMAVLTMSVPIPVSPIPVAPSPERGQFAIIGYTSDRPHMLSAGFGCGGHPNGAALWLECAVRSGNSGGPILLQTNDGWRVVGVVSAGNGAATLAARVDEFLFP